jgi:N-acetyl-D-muramate 6-phosphate phosphatase
MQSESGTILSPESVVLFDLDGTLVDTAPDFIAVIIRLCESYNVPPPSSEAIHATVSAGARALVTLAFQIDAGHTDFPALHQNLLDAYEKQLLDTQSRLYPDMDRLLQLLENQGTPWGVVTNKPERFAKPLLEKLVLLQRCAVLVCPDHVGQTKPHPEPLFLACAHTSTKPGCSVYIGDHPRDIEAGSAAGMMTIAAAFGYLPEAPDIKTWGADLIVHSTNDIIDYFWPHNPSGPND